MAETNKRKRPYAELLNNLGQALLERGQLADELYNTIAAKREKRKEANNSKWFSEERYIRRAEYYQLKANIVAIRRDIKANRLKIAHLEDQISYHTRTIECAVDECANGGDHRVVSMPHG